MAAHVRQARRLRRIIARRPRQFRDRSNPLEDLEPDEVFRRYRFLPDTIMYILREIHPIDIIRTTNRNSPLPPLLQLLVCLRFLATGAMHLLVGDSLNISRSAAGRCIRDVTLKILQISRGHIKFPSGRGAEEVKTAFGKVAGFPNVLGCIDGTQVRIQRPTENEPDYVNRKGYHSLNVQMCCDANFKFTSCNASWPGSVHDSRIFRTSALCLQFENGQHNGILLGDSGYPCRSFLMVPFLSPNSPAEERFNSALCRTRVLVEQSFGILKRRFQILHHGINTKPSRAIIYIVACVTLHNIGIDRGDIIPRDDDDNVDGMRDDEDGIGNGAVGQLLADGFAMRQHIVDTYFNV